MTGITKLKLHHHGDLQPVDAVNQDLLAACESALEFFEASDMSADTLDPALQEKLDAKLMRLEPHMIPLLRKAVAKAQGKQFCRVCGCTDEHGCLRGCWWVKKDLCSVCDAKLKRRVKKKVG